ncbi:pyruvate kinase PKM-like [Gracilinanus agilis]|uniref:pyruvate kinase PKM-like n=1 Tax=Gracilinanus agilis TaxID=191870 RepID=UPI001CFCE54E|nr:pyruvate kinase PKM-like [Gracilinanus agilis]
MDKSVSSPDLPISPKQEYANKAENFLEYMCRLCIDSEPSVARNTAIICTIGPASQSVETLKKMISTGMNVARINTCHGSYEDYVMMIKNVRAATESFLSDPTFYRPIAIALDIQGPSVRTGLVKGSETGEVELKKGKSIKITLDEAYKEKCDENILWVDNKSVLSNIKIGGNIYVDNGLICLVVKEKDNSFLLTEVTTGGMLGSRKCLNFPGLYMDFSLTTKDKEDIKFGIEQNVDMVFASFIQKANDVHDIRKVLGEKGEHVMVISKIENHEGVRNFDEILKVSDGIMIARGDLGIEIPPQKVFIAQKMMIGRCNLAGKPVICATQMLQSMIKKPRPTRAESSDIANAVLDGVDCIMLSGETAKGDYPLECIEVSHRIAREAEAATFHLQLFNELFYLVPQNQDFTDITAVGAVKASFNYASEAIIVLTDTGKSAYFIARYRPRVPILAVIRDAQIARQVNLYRGIFPIHYLKPVHEVWTEDVEMRITYAMEVGKAHGFFKKNDMVIVVSGWCPEIGCTNTMHMVSVS